MKYDKSNKLMERHYEILSHLSALPRKILSFHEKEYITQYILHELCKEQCFNIHKAAYFVDSPDFDCLKGVAGHSISDLNQDFQENFHSFAKEIDKSEFNNKVKQLNEASFKKDQKDQTKRAAHIANDLEIKNYAYCSWNMKHDNHGLFIYENQDQSEKIDENELLNGLSLLSFCPFF